MSSYVLHVACSPYNSFEKRNIRIQIKCTAAAGVAIDTAVFAYRLINNEYLFDHICSTVDMAEYPIADEAYIHNGESFKWCRKDYVDLLVRTLSIAEDFIDNVVSDVRLLYYNMEAHNEVVGTNTYFIGTVPEYITVDQNSDSNLVTTLAANEQLTVATSTKAGGTLSKVNQDGRYSLYYTPPRDVFGEDSFSYTVTNVENVDKTYTIAVTILNNATKNSVQQITDTVTGPINIVYDNSGFEDWLSPDTNTWVIRSNDNVVPRHGTISIVNNTTIKYTPNNEYIGDDDFDYYVYDGLHTVKVHCVICDINTQEENG